MDALSMALASRPRHVEERPDLIHRMPGNWLRPCIVPVETQPYAPGHVIHTAAHGAGAESSRKVNVDGRKVSPRS